MPKWKDISGQKFGRLVVQARIESDRHGNARWQCLCDCGKSHSALGQSLRSGAIVSCGCYASEHAGDSGRTHGASGTSAYKAWYAMTQRCTNPNNPKWHRYGGRGIKVCARWQDYTLFLADMGKRPLGMSLDRKDNDGNYEPSNCRWATPLEQASNRNNNVRVSVDGACLTASEASRRLGENRGTVSRRIRDGWSPEAAANTPLQHQGNLK